MGKFRKITAVLLVAVLFSVFHFGLANAVQFQTGSNVSLAQENVVNDTLFMAGRNVDINSQVNGDIFCAGQTVTISGRINGDVICAGQTVNITGSVEGDVRLAGQTVTIGADVKGNATVGGQSFTLESTGKVDGDLSVGSTDAFINGEVGRDVIAGGTNLTIAGDVGRNVKAGITNLTVASSATVGDNIEYTSSNEANISDQANVEGSVTRSEPPETEAPKNMAVFGFGVAWFIFLFLAMLVTALVLVLLFPQVIHRTTNRALPRPWRALLTGFVACIVGPLLLLLLAITVVGIPLAILAGLIWLVVLFLSGPIFGYYLGRLILRDVTNPIWIMLAGAGLLLVLYFIPIIGFFALLAAIWIGAGMILMEIYNHIPKPQYSVAKTETKKK